MKHPKDYRQQIYGYIEELLGRSLTYEEHDDLRDMLGEFAENMQNPGTYFRRVLCLHDWVSDRKVEGGQHSRIYVKCRKCDKRAQKKMPTIAMDV